MATVRPFRAVRPAADKANDVAALPYDVMNSEEARQMVVGKPFSFLHIDKQDMEDLIRLGFEFKTKNMTFRREELKEFLKANPLLAHEDINEVKRRFRMLKEEAEVAKNQQGLE
mgnify:CR=1 FL=1